MGQRNLNRIICSRWELFTLILGSFFSHDSLKNIDRSSIITPYTNQTQEYLVNLINFREKIDFVFPMITGVITILMIGVFIGVLRTSTKRITLDVIGISLILRFIYQISCSNLLIFNRLKPNDQLLLEVILLFLSSIIIFGWIYWRIDYKCKEGPNRHITLKHNKYPFEYFYFASIGLQSRVALTSAAETLKMKIITYIHALCMFDLFGLSFSHAVALAMK